MAIYWHASSGGQRVAFVLAAALTLAVGFVLGSVWERAEVGKMLSEVPPTATSSSPTMNVAETPVVGAGAHCGGFIRNAPVCGSGYHCVLVPSRPDTGGTCVADAATDTARISGVVTLGPTCPVERIPPLSQCADKPYQTIVTLSNDASAETASMLSNADGAFSFFPLAPGAYTLSARGGAPLPRCASVHVTVRACAVATTTLMCDSGIR